MAQYWIAVNTLYSCYRNRNDQQPVEDSLGTSESRLTNEDELATRGSWDRGCVSRRWCQRRTSQRAWNINKFVWRRPIPFTHWRTPSTGEIPQQEKRALVWYLFLDPKVKVANPSHAAPGKSGIFVLYTRHCGPLIQTLRYLSQNSILAKQEFWF